MRRRFTRGPSRAPFRRRRRRRVSWLTDNNQRGSTSLNLSGELNTIVLTHVDNDFVENHPVFAKRNDNVKYVRVLGELRFALYNAENLTLREGLDYTVEYGICFIEGDYDNSGVWTQSDTVPNPAETGDEDEKWLYKNRVIFSFGALQTHFFNYVGTELALTDTNTPPLLDVNTATNGTVGLVTLQQETRPRMMSTDEQLPNGSKIDIHTGRRAIYSEKLAIVARVETDNTDTENVEIFCDHNLRVLIHG